MLYYTTHSQREPKSLQKAANLSWRLAAFMKFKV